MTSTPRGRNVLREPWGRCPFAHTRFFAAFRCCAAPSAIGFVVAEPVAIQFVRYRTYNIGLVSYPQDGATPCMSVVIPEARLSQDFRHGAPPATHPLR